MIERKTERERDGEEDWRTKTESQRKKTERDRFQEKLREDPDTEKTNMKK